MSGKQSRENAEKVGNIAGCDSHSGRQQRKKNNSENDTNKPEAHTNIGTSANSMQLSDASLPNQSPTQTNVVTAKNCEHDKTKREGEKINSQNGANMPASQTINANSMTQNTTATQTNNANGMTQNEYSVSQTNVVIPENCEDNKTKKERKNRNSENDANTPATQTMNAISMTENEYSQPQTNIVTPENCEDDKTKKGKDRNSENDANMPATQTMNANSMTQNEDSEAGIPVTENLTKGNGGTIQHAQRLPQNSTNTPKICEPDKTENVAGCDQPVVSSDIGEQERGKRNTKLLKSDTNIPFTSSNISIPTNSLTQNEGTQAAMHVEASERSLQPDLSQPQTYATSPKSSKCEMSIDQLCEALNRDLTLKTEHDGKNSNTMYTAVSQSQYKESFGTDSETNPLFWDRKTPAMSRPVTGPMFGKDPENQQEKEFIMFAVEFNCIEPLQNENVCYNMSTHIRKEQWELLSNSRKLQEYCQSYGIEIGVDLHTKIVKMQSKKKFRKEEAEKLVDKLSHKMLQFTEHPKIVVFEGDEQMANILGALDIAVFPNVKINLVENNLVVTCIDIETIKNVVNLIYSAAKKCYKQFRMAFILPLISTMLEIFQNLGFEKYCIDNCKEILDVVFDNAKGHVVIRSFSNLVESVFSLPWSFKNGWTFTNLNVSNTMAQIILNRRKTLLQKLKKEHDLVCWFHPSKGGKLYLITTSGEDSLKAGYFLRKLVVERPFAAREGFEIFLQDIVKEKPRLLAFNPTEDGTQIDVAVLESESKLLFQIIETYQTFGAMSVIDKREVLAVKLDENDELLHGTSPKLVHESDMQRTENEGMKIQSCQAVFHPSIQAKSASDANFVSHHKQSMKSQKESGNQKEEGGCTLHLDDKCNALLQHDDIYDMLIIFLRKKNVFVKFIPETQSLMLLVECDLDQVKHLLCHFTEHFCVERIERDDDIRADLDYIAGQVAQELIEQRNKETTDKGSQNTFISKEKETGMVRVHKAGAWFVCFETAISDIVGKYLKRFKTVERVVTMPLYAVELLSLKLSEVNTKLQKEVHKSVIVTIRPSTQMETDKLNIQNVVVSAANQQNISIANAWLIDFLLTLEITEKEIDDLQAVYLQGIHGGNILQSLESENLLCRVDVKQTNFQRAEWSINGGSKIIVTNSTMMFTDGDIFVLPIMEGMIEWPFLHAIILKSCLLADDIKIYHDKLTALQQKNVWKLRLHCNGDFEGKVLNLISLPGKWDDGKKKEKAKMRHAFKATFEDCDSTHQSVAVAVFESPEMPLKHVVKSLLQTFLKDCKGTEDVLPGGCRNILIYTDKFADVHRIVEELNILKRRPEKAARPHLGNQRITVVISSMENIEADVVVNSTSSDLKFDGGPVEKAILKAAGNELLQYCTHHFKDGIKLNGMAVTSSFKMNNAKRLYHVALSREIYTNVLEASNGMYKAAVLLHDLGQVVHRCLLQATFDGFKSIAFPTLGSGNLQYPCELVAQTMFKVIRNFFLEMPQSSLEEVKIVAFHKNAAAIQAFKKEEISHLYTHNTDGIIEAVLHVNRHIVQLVQSSEPMKSCPLDTCIDKLHHSQESSEVSNIKKEFQKKLDEALQLHKFSSVQIYAPTLGINSPEFMALAIKQVLDSHRQNCCHLVTVISNDPEMIATFPTVFFGEGNVKMSQAENRISVIAVKPMDVMHKLSQENCQVPADVKARYNVIEAAEKAASAQQKDKQDRCRISIPKTMLKIEDFHKVITDWNGDETQKPGEIIFKVPLTDLQTFANGFVKYEDPKTEEKNNPPTLETKVEKTGQCAKTLCALEVEALRFLMKDSFEQGFIVKEQSGVCHISFKGATSEDLVSKIEALRREDCPLSSEEVSRLEDEVDVYTEGINAFIKTIRAEKKAAIFSFDYNAITKAKHLLAVKAGRVKVTARGKRKFDEGAGSGDSSVTSSHYSALERPGTNKPLDFLIAPDIEVSVYESDITKLPVDVVVNAANENLQHGGGVAYAISKAAGYKLEDEGQEYIMKNGPIKVSGIAVTTGGNMPCKKVLHAVGPRWIDYQDKEKCKQLLIDTVVNSLNKASDMGFTSIAFPSISAAIFGVPPDICAVSYSAAVVLFAKTKGINSSLRFVHFVDVNSDMVKLIQNAFSLELKKTDRKTVKPTDNNAEQLHIKHPDDHNNQNNWRTETSLSQSNQTQGKTETIDPSAISCSSKGQLPSIQGEQNIVSASAPKIPDTSNEVKKKEALKQEPLGLPYLLPTQQSDMCQQSIGFHGHDMVITFEKKSVKDIDVEVLVLWQDIQNICKDNNSKQCLQDLSRQASSRLSELKKSLNKVGVIEHLDTKDKTYILPVVSLGDINSKTVEQLTQNALSIADKQRKLSVAVPLIPIIQKNKGLLNRRKEGVSEDMDSSFAIGVYAGIKNYLKQHYRSVKKIYIIDPDNDAIQGVTNAVSTMIGNERSLADTPLATLEICVICREIPVKPKRLHCGHLFCTHCIDEWTKKGKPECPVCKMTYGVRIGDQPDGLMLMNYTGVPMLMGFNNCGYYTITYTFMGGYQQKYHPNPGTYYSRTDRYAYLPDTEEGRKVLMLLKVAFDRRLVFTIGVSSTSGSTGIIWNDIHHKTVKIGGPERHGYPDPGYLSRVQQQLAAVGVTEKCLHEVHWQFIKNPQQFQSHMNFSHCFPRETGV